MNTASVTSSPAIDTNPANDSATDTDTVDTSADLSITKTDGVASVIAGNSTTYTIVLTNNGPSTEPAGVVLSDPIPAGTMAASTSDPDCAHRRSGRFHVHDDRAARARRLRSRTS